MRILYEKEALWIAQLEDEIQYRYRDPCNPAMDYDLYALAWNHLISLQKQLAIRTKMHWFPPSYLTRLLSLPPLKGLSFDTYLLTFCSIRLKGDQLPCGFLRTLDHLTHPVVRAVAESLIQYTLLLCIKKDKTLRGGNLIVHLCDGSAPIPMEEKTALLFRNTMTYEMEEVSGSGEMMLLRVEFCYS